MARQSGEMPFLDHLEELRGRILRSLLAIVVCFGGGLWLVNQFRLVDLLKAPIAQYLPNGQLTVLSPTEPLMIVLKLGLITGLVLASPVILWQVWAFLSPALYEREKKTIVPALFVGLLLFLTGAALSFVFIVPQAIRVLLSFQQGSFATMITFDNYFSFVMQLVLALGLSCELPLLMIILAALGLIGTRQLNRIRPYAVVGSFIAGAILSPGADVLSMFMLTIPLLFLYEVGVAGVWVIQRRRLKSDGAGAAGATGAVLLLACLAAPPARAQQPAPPPPRPQMPRPGPPSAADSAKRVEDSTRAAAGRRLDSASARRLGLPSAPRQSFPPPDSIISELMDLDRYAVTRYRADSASVQTSSRSIDLMGNAMTERGGAIVEAGSIQYREGECGVVAKGEPHLFQGAQVLIGAEARFDTCRDRGVVSDAFTNFKESGGNWFVRGNLAVDSSRSRLYGGSAELTSCDLPIPHYHFATRQIKWVSKSTMVARPAVLYIRDVPIFWIPFIFQDTKPGRRSGILIPQLGFNDIVRSSRSYNRQVSNLGFYWAPNDYFDAQFQLDWFSKRYVQYGVVANYKVRDRFLGGQVGYSVQAQTGGGTARSINWSHRQDFNNTTSINLDARYSTNTSIVARNSIDPLVVTQDIRSNGNFTKRFAWGNLSVGGTRTQSITDGSGTMTLPTVTLTPKPLDFGSFVTWSPGLSFTNTIAFKTPLAPVLIPGLPGLPDTVKQTGGTRNSRVSFDTPIRLGSFNWRNSLEVVDADSTGRYQSTFRVPDLTTPDPNDSVSVSQVRSGGFGSSLNWETSINLPILFPTKFKLTPTLGITNASTQGAFAIRNARTGGQFVYQGKRLALGASIAPTFFAFFPGIFGVARFRHSVSPIVSYSYSPKATVSEGYARAVALPGQAFQRTSPASQSLSVGLSQNFEAKARPAPGDSTGANARKFRILGINTSGFVYDFEQAKLEGRTGWTNQTVTNTLASDLVPGFSLNLTHDLWEGPVGFKGSKFKPFLQSISTSFSITGRTFQQLGSLFGLGKAPPAQPGQVPGTTAAPPIQPFQGGMNRNMLLTPSQPLDRGASRSFNSTIQLNISRTRATATQPSTNQSSIGLRTTFSPTRFWGVNWSTQYNFADHQFEAQQIQLSRDLHEWRATFNFVKSPNGNFAFYFAVFLTDFPDINYKYNQSTIKP